MDQPSFHGLGLSPKVLAAIEAVGYTTPTPIQQKAIPISVTGRDVLGIAQTGTGKTAAFVLPMLTRLESGRARARMPRTLILEPTRELAAQVAEAFDRYGVNHKLNVALLIGGVSFDEQDRKLDRGADVLIATPGRLLDHFQRGKLMMMGVEILVIDEADRMLDMGFIPDIERICKLLPPRRQTLFFSATMPPEITRLVGQFLKDPQRIEVAPPATTAKTIVQRFQMCGAADYEKRESLRQLIRSQPIKNAIIFCNRKRDVAILHRSLVRHGFNAGALHGDMDQHQRTATLDAFRRGEIMLLAASDVAARGLDIPDVSHIFNFDVPLDADDYVHRIGRTGRAGREGHAFTLVTVDDMKLLSQVEKMLGEKNPVEWIGEPPTDEERASAGRRRGRRGAPGRGGSVVARSGRSEGGRGERSGRDGRRGGARRDRGERSGGGHHEDRRRGRGGRGEAGERDAGGIEEIVPIALHGEDTGERARREGERGQGGEPRERPRQDRRRQRRADDRPHGERRERSEEASVQEAGRQEEERRPRREARGGGEQPRQEREQRPQRSGRHRERDRDRDRDRSGGKQAPVVGLGDHMPEFLRKPVKAVRSPTG